MMKKEKTRENGICLVSEKLNQLNFIVTPTPGRNPPGDLTVAKSGSAEKTVKVHACQDNDGGNCPQMHEIREKAVEKARQVDFHVFVKLNGDEIVESFVWHRDDVDLIEKRGKKFGLFPYRVSRQDKWQERKDEAGWKLIKSHMAAE